MKGEKIMICAEIKNNGEISVYESTVSDGVKHETVKFKFPTEWKDYKKTAVFGYEGNIYNVTLDMQNVLCVSEDECYIPHEVLKPPMFTLSVFGVQGDKIATTEQIGVKVKTSGYALGDEPEEPTPNEYLQIISIMKDTQEIANSVRNDADNGLFKGEKGDNGLQGEKGEKGEKGDKGDKGDPGEITKSYAEDTFAPLIKNSVKNYVVAIKDLAEINSNLKVQLKSNTITDFSNVKVKVMGKNILPYPYTDTTKTYNGITYTDNGDGTITVNGTATADSYFKLCDSSPHPTNLSFGMANISGCPTGGSAETYYLNCVTTGHKDIGSGVRFSFKGNYMRFYIWIKSGTKVENLVFRPMVEIGPKYTSFEKGYKNEFLVKSDGTIDEISLMPPNITIIPDTENVYVNAAYKADTKLYIDNKIASI